MDIGTLAGRHAMPVERYILPGDVTPGQAAYDAAYLAAESMAHALADQGVTCVRLHYARLTEVTLGCLDALEKAVGEDWPAVIIPMRFDAASGQYVPFRRGIPPEVQAARERHTAAVCAAAKDVQESCRELGEYFAKQRKAS